MTPADAQALQDDATARGTWLASSLARIRPITTAASIWPAHSSPTLEELQTMLPGGLARHGRTSIDPPEVAEVWD